MLPVGEHEDAELYAAEVFLDDDAGRGLAELAAQHLVQVGLGGGQVALYEDALAGCQSVGLEHVGRLEAFQEALALGQGLGGEGAVLCGGYLVAGHEGLGVVLAAFEHGAVAGGPYHHHMAQRALPGEVVGYAGHQRCLGAYHHHLYAVVEHEACHCLEVAAVQGHVLAHGGRAGVAGGYVEFLATRALCYLDGYGVFAAARPDEEYVHGSFRYGFKMQKY